jgi:hypothetical protein
MQQIVIKLWCDQHHSATGEKVEATEVRDMAYQGKPGHWDLCAPCAAELDAVTGQWLRSAQREDARPTAVADFRPGSRESRRFYEGLRAWADSQGRTEEYLIRHRPGSKSAKVNYRYDTLLDDYEAYLAARATAA